MTNEDVDTDIPAAFGADQAEGDEPIKKRPRGRPRKIALQDSVDMRPVANVMQRVPRDQPSEWVVSRGEEDADFDRTPVRAAMVRPVDEDTIRHAADEVISDDEIRARREAARAVVADIGRMKDEVKSMHSYIVAPPAVVEEPPSGEADLSDDEQQPLSRRDYWRQRRQERYLQRQQRRANGSGGAPTAQQVSGGGGGRHQNGAGTHAPTDAQPFRQNNRRDRQRVRQNSGRAGFESAGHEAHLPQETLPPMNMSDLQALPLSALLSMAGEQGLLSDTLASRTQRDVVFALLRNYVGRGGSIVGEGVLEISQEGHGYLRNRWNSFKNCPEDPMVPLQLIRKFGLRGGDQISGPTRPPSRDQRDRRLVLTDISVVNAASPAESASVPAFESLIPSYPGRRLRLEVSADDLTLRVVDLFAPVGFGQRALVIAPLRSGKTDLLRRMANAISVNHPKTERILLLVAERPEEVAEIKQGTDAQVYASMFEEDPESHVQMVEVALDLARRNAERGQDVVVLIDSLTRLAKACLVLETQGSRSSDRDDIAYALLRVKRAFASARQLDGGGSLTIVATALDESGSELDAAILASLVGAGNMELRLLAPSFDGVERPFVDMARSGTLKADRFVAPEELKQVASLRRSLSGILAEDAAAQLAEQMRMTSTNADLLATVKI